MIFFIFLTSFPFLTAIFPETNDDYKMLITYGKPLKYSGYQLISSDFDTCVLTCWSDSNCVMVFEASNTTCQLFTVPNITTVQRTSNGSRVAFRGKSNDTLCPSVSPLLSGTVTGDLERLYSDGGFKVYITFNITMSAGIWTVSKANYLYCYSQFTFVQREKGVWCLWLAQWTGCVTQALASTACALYRYSPRISGIESLEEYELIKGSLIRYRKGGI